MWIENSNGHSKFSILILNNLSSLFPISWFLLSLFPVDRHLHFLLRMTTEANPPIRHKIHIMKVAERSPRHVHDVTGESAAFYPWLASKLNEFGIDRLRT
jgi:hypothetical protein